MSSKSEGWTVSNAEELDSRHDDYGSNPQILLGGSEDPEDDITYDAVEYADVNSEETEMAVVMEKLLYQS